MYTDVKNVGIPAFLVREAPAVVSGRGRDHRSPAARLAPVALRRPAPRRPRRRGGRPSDRAHDVLLRRLRGRRLEDDGRRDLLGERVRRLLRDLGGRRARRRALGAERASTRAPARRASAATSRTATGSIAPTDGGRTWTERGPARHPPHRARARAPARPRPRLRGGARPRLGPEPRARRLPLPRRRRHLGARAVQERAGGRHRPVDRPAEPARPASPPCGRRSARRGA